MPFATVTGVRSSWEMFARKSAFADVPWDTFARSSSSSVSSSIARTTVRATSAPNAVATIGGEDDAASERGTDRAEHDLGTLLAQDVPGGAGGEGLGDDGEGRVPSRERRRSWWGRRRSRRRTSSGPPGPPRPRSTTTTSGRVRAVDSTARNASDVTSIWRSGAAWSKWYCRRATSSAESKSSTVAICWGYRPTLRG